MRNFNSLKSLVLNERLKKIKKNGRKRIFSTITRVRKGSKKKILSTYGKVKTRLKALPRPERKALMKGFMIVTIVYGSSMLFTVFRTPIANAIDPPEVLAKLKENGPNLLDGKPQPWPTPESKALAIPKNNLTKQLAKVPDGVANGIENIPKQWKPEIRVRIAGGQEGRVNISLGVNVGALSVLNTATASDLLGPQVVLMSKTNSFFVGLACGVALIIGLSYLGVKPSPKSETIIVNGVQITLPLEE